MEVSTKDQVDTITRSLMSDGLEKLGSGEARPVPPRRRWSEAEKRRIVAESYQPGVSVSIVARRNDVNANLVFTWRRQYRERGRFRAGCCRAGSPAAAPEGGRHRRSAVDGADGDRTGGRGSGDRRPGGGRRGAGAGSFGSGAAMIPVSGGGSCLAGERRDRHATRHEHVGATGPGGSRARPSRGRSLRVPGTSRRPGQDSLA